MTGSGDRLVDNSDAGAAPGEDRVLTIPNLLSFGRLLCVPLFLWLLFGLDDRLAAALLLAVLGITDWVDGFVARRFNQVSTLGKILDPTADRLLLGVAIVAILIDGSVPAWLAWLAIVREAAVGTMAVVLAALGARRMDVSREGKVGTFALMVAFPLFLASEADFVLNDAARVVAWPAAIAGLAFAWYAAARYVPQGLRALREGRQGRVAKAGGDT